jgi:hypothetical protein
MTLESKKALAEFLRKQLADVEAEIALLTKNEVVKVEKVEKVFDIQAEVEKMSKTVKWKKYMNTGVVDNIVSILDECYSFYVDTIKTDYPHKKPSSIVGAYMSPEWTKFKFLTIKKLINPKDFDEEYDYGDTANGCDEVACDAGFELLKELAEKA